jgi:hypothetical protein
MPMETLVSAEIMHGGTAFVKYKMRCMPQQGGRQVEISDTFEAPADLKSLDVQPFKNCPADGEGCVREGVEVRTTHQGSDGVASAWTWRIGLSSAKRQCIEVLHERG